MTAKQSLLKGFLLLITSCCLLATIAGCGYTTRSLIADQFKTIYIESSVNKIDITTETDAGYKYKIYRPALEIDITKAVIDKFLLDGNLKPIKEAKADLVLKAELIEFRRDPLRYNDNDDVEEYRISLVVNLKLFDTKENKLVWQENSFTGDATYFTAFSSTGIVKTDDQAVSDAIDDLSRRIVERTVEQW